MASTSEILPVCKIRRLAGPTQEILRKSEAHQMLTQSLGPRTQSSGPSGTKLGSPRHKAGVGSRTKRVPSGLLHLGGCIVLHELTRSRLYCARLVGAQGCIVGTCGTWVRCALRTMVAPTWRHCCYTPSGPIQHCPLNAPQ